MKRRKNPLLQRVEYALYRLVASPQIFFPSWPASTDRC